MRYLRIFKEPCIVSTLFIFFAAMSPYGQQRKETNTQLDSLFLLMNTNPDKAIEISSGLYEQYRGNPQMEISVLTIIGSSYSIKKDYEKAIEYALKTREISQKIHDYPTQIQVAGFIGEKYHNLNINSKAKYFFDEAYDLIEKHPLPDSLKFYKGNILFLKGLIYKDELGCEFATDYYDQALKEYKLLQKEKKILRFSISDIYNEKGFCFLEKQQLDSARIAFETALHYSKTEEFSVLESESWAGLGRVFYLNKEYKEAQKAFDKALHIIDSKKVESFNPVVYKYVSDNYYLLNDIDKYTHYLNLYKQLTNNYISAKKSSVNEMIDKSSVKEESQDKSGKYWLVIGILLIILFILIAVIIYQISVMKRKIREYKRQIPEHTPVSEDTDKQ